MSRQSAQGFVEVRDEPLHRFLFENDYVHVYDVLIPARDASLYHRHAEDTLYVTLTDGMACARELGGEDEVRPRLRGAATCLHHRHAPLIHQVENVGDRDLRFIGAEIKASPPLTAGQPLQAPGVRLERTTARLRVYRVSLAPGGILEVGRWRFSSLLVGVNEASLRLATGDAGLTLTVAPGGVLWREPGGAADCVANVGRASFEAVLAEWL